MNFSYSRVTRWVGQILFALLGFASPLLAQPLNDDCSSATMITIAPSSGCSMNSSGTLRGATASTEVSACIGTANDDVWYTFAATSPAVEVTLSNVAGAPLNLVHALYSGACGTLSLVACSDPNFSFIPGLTVGTTYYLRVHSSGSMPGASTTFDLCVNDAPPPPANDACSSASPLTLSPDDSCANAITGTTRGATRSTNPDLCSQQSNDDDVWYTFIAPATAPFLFSLANTARVTYLNVYEGDCNGSLTSIGDCLVPASNSVDLVAGQSYFIQVHTASISLRTDFSICVRQENPPPPNDDCVDATTIAVVDNADCANTIFGTLEGATSSGMNNQCVGTENDDVWYTFMATTPAVDIKLLRIRGNIRDLVHSVYSGSCGSLTQISCVDNPEESTVTGLIPGDFYFLRINTWTSVDGATSTFNLCLSPSQDQQLPVSFADFSGRPAAKTNLLQWSTTAEENTDYFAVERSANGTDGWETIGESAARGGANELTQYQFTDEAPVAVGFYRIRSVDFDLASDLSKVISIQRASSELLLASVFPNPATNRISVALELPVSGELTLSLFDATGRVFRKIESFPAKGAFTQEIEVADLPPGVYFLRANFGDNNQMLRVVVQ